MKNLVLFGLQARQQQFALNFIGFTDKVDWLSCLRAAVDASAIEIDDAGADVGTDIRIRMVFRQIALHAFDRTDRGFRSLNADMVLFRLTSLLGRKRQPVQQREHDQACDDQSYDDDSGREKYREITGRKRRAVIHCNG